MEVDNVLVQAANNEDKWTVLRHNGPYFWKPFQPPSVQLFYDGKPINLTPEAEELAVAYANSSEEHKNNNRFNENFFNDWQLKMTEEQRQIISDITKCNFSQYENKNLVESDPNIEEQYSFCWIDEMKMQINNWKIERPGLFQGSGNEIYGKWKRRIVPEDVIINCSAGHQPPAPEGHQWKGIVTNKKVLWLAKWQDPITSYWKYIKLSRSSYLRMKIDRQKFDVAKKFGEDVQEIRRSYWQYIQSDDILNKQLGIALYLIDQFVFRAGNEKSDRNDADTVGCCSLRVEHIKLHKKTEEIEFDFSSKGCQPFQRKQKIDKKAFEVLSKIIGGKNPTDKIFNKLTPDKVNKVLKDFNSKYTTKVFRTFRASALFEEKLRKTNQDITNKEKLMVFGKAALAVAELCNHMRKDNNLEKKIRNLKQTINKPPPHKFMADHIAQSNKKKAEDIKKLEEELRKQSSETAMDNYIDPRIVVAWCKQYSVPIKYVYSKQLREWFKWAIDLAIPDYVFYMPPQSNEPEPGPSGQSPKNRQQQTLDACLIKKTRPLAQKRKHN